MTLTLAITVYNRYQMLLESFAGVIDDPRIDEVLIMDDCSAPEYWDKIKELPKFNPKIRVVRQLENRGMSVNKRDAVFNSRNGWVILFDSDNIIGKDYLDALEANAYWFPSDIYCPSFAKPNFDYRHLEKCQFSKKDHTDFSNPMNECLFNTCNYVVHKEFYLNVWEENKDMVGSDTIWFNYLWMKRGGSLYVVPGMHYEHRVHPGSGFMENVDYNMKQSQKVKMMITKMWEESLK